MDLMVEQQLIQRNCFTESLCGSWVVRFRNCIKGGWPFRIETNYERIAISTANFNYSVLTTIICCYVCDWNGERSIRKFVTKNCAGIVNIDRAWRPGSRESKARASKP